MTTKIMITLVMPNIQDMSQVGAELIVDCSQTPKVRQLTWIKCPVEDHRSDKIDERM
jgi:hypothetical protein